MRYPRRKSRYNAKAYAQQAQAVRRARFEEMDFPTLLSVVETIELERQRLLAEHARQFPRQPELDRARTLAAVHWAKAQKESKNGAKLLGIVRSRASVTKERYARAQGQVENAKASSLEREKATWETQLAASIREVSYDLDAATAVMNKAMQDARRVERERREAEEARRKKAREMEVRQSIAARLAAADDASRDLARSVRVRISKCAQCPYCQGPMSVDAECDHIVPVVKGGLSTATNMVYVCRPCNQAKSHMTLFQFCRLQGFDFMQVVSRLEKWARSSEWRDPAAVAVR